MIISPPFLPSAQASEEAWLEAAMREVPGQGRFPLSLGLQWHNGLHLQAPRDAQGSGHLPVCAIADGVVRFVGKPSAPTPEPRHPQNYNPSTRNESEADNLWTDNGIVILEHTTDIGADPTTGAATTITYYSAYQHLREIAKTIDPTKKPPAQKELAAGDRIWRKDILGQPGAVFGQKGQLHFEIAFGPEALRKLLGRAPHWQDFLASASALRPSADGRGDSVFGHLYIYLPPTTPMLAQEPRTHLGTRATATLGGDGQWVRIAWDRGDARLTSYTLGGQEITPAAPSEAGAEYNLYATAVKRHQSLSPPQQVGSSPSGWYELLRFGRNLGPDPLPAGAEHWRRIATPGGLVWADLNTPSSFKLSDADFPAVAGWNCHGEDNPGKDRNESDQRCEDTDLKRLIADPADRSDQRLATSELNKRLGFADVQEKLKRLICKFPAEWDKATAGTRYGWLKQEPRFQKSEDAWKRLEAHLNATCFDGLPDGYVKAVWHINPKVFIAHMRRCLWLSEKEAIQMFPPSALRKTTTGWVNEPIQPNKTTLRLHLTHLNRATRKYCITTPKRLAAFYGNAMQETQWFELLEESNGQKTRYAPWHGRGFLQLTWPANYIKYARFKGRQVSAQLEAQLNAAQSIAEKARNNAALQALEGQIPSDIKNLRDALSPRRGGSVEPGGSAGAYWAWSQAARSADQPSTYMRVSVTTQGGTTSYYTHASFGNVAATVNVGHPSTNYGSIYGVQARFQAHAAAAMVLMDREQFPDAQGHLKHEPEGWIRRIP